MKRLEHEMNYQRNWFDDHPIVLYVLIAYIVISGLMMFGDIRRPLVNWYRSQGWVMAGNGPIDILFKQIGYRLTVEAFAFGVACLMGSIGGNIYIIMRARKVRSVEQL